MADKFSQSSLDMMMGIVDNLDRWAQFMKTDIKFSMKISHFIP